ncbi:MAG: hypothetical protein IKY57_02150, partial [Alistipes sp.]|nr:hypothetical protein [Alistipes sp.]
MLKKSIFALLVAVMNIGFAEAVVAVDVKREAERATSLIEHGRFAEARRSLTLLRERVPIDDEVLVRHIDFELALCAAELRDNDTEKILLAFLRRYPESVHVNDVRFLLAMYHCEREEYTMARKYL